MSLSDRFRFLLGKDGETPSAAQSAVPAPTPSVSRVAPGQTGAPSPAPVKATPPAKTSPTLEELDTLLAKERSEGEIQLQAVEKEIQSLRVAIEKSELASKTRRDQQQQALDYLQQDAEREIKFLERKLQDDQSSWGRQLAEREKALEQAARQVEADKVQKKTSFEGAFDAQQEALQRAEQLLKEQEATLALERQKWQELLESKENEILSLRQEIGRRESELEKELAHQETQRKAAQELWQTRLVELERLSAEKRKVWEESMKGKEEERQQVQATLQERLAAWQLDQERRLQETVRRQERANDRISALKTHLVKETQTWQQLSQAREEQLQQLKVKLLLSESDAKGRLEQAQKKFRESATLTAGQVQGLQQKLREEQQVWKQQVDEKDASIAAVKEDIRAKLRHLENEYAQRLTAIQADKEGLEKQLHGLQEQNAAEQARYVERLQQLKGEQTALDLAHQKKLTDLQKRNEEESALLHARILTLEQQRTEGERALENARLRWQEELVHREQALKETQASIGPQEAELRKRFGAEEDTQNRQVEALRTRQRALERELLRARENTERVEKEHTAAADALNKDHYQKEEALKKRFVELEARLQKRLGERRLALDAFQAMKKDEETRMQSELQTKESERAEWAGRLERLPLELQKALDEKKEAIRVQSDALRIEIAALEAELAADREQAKAVIQAKATLLATLRQALDEQHKELSSTLKSREQLLESERASAEKQLVALQAEMDRLRAHWQGEFAKKEEELMALQGELNRQDQAQKQVLEQERKNFELQLVPVEAQRQELASVLERERVQHEQELVDLEKEELACQARTRQLSEEFHAQQAAAEIRFRQDRAQSKAQLEGLLSEKAAVEQSAQEAVSQKALQVEQLEEQLHAQAVAHEGRRRELMHNATLKARTLQDIIHQIETELKNNQEVFPRELKAREESIARAQQDLAVQQERHQQTLTRFDRAQATLARRAKQKEEALRAQLAVVQNEWAQKIAAQDTEIAALQSNLLGQEAERHGELDRLAKQFAEERFQLEKSKEEVEWKLKDHKEVAERQLAGRQKEIQYLETELARAKLQRDDQLAQRSATFEAEKQKLQGALGQLQQQTDDLRKKEESTLAAKDQELQTILTGSKQRLQTLTEEFNQKVNSWRGTNEALKSQIEQLKAHLTQAQDLWEVLRKEKANELGSLRQELTQWEARLQNDAQALERVHDQDRQMLISQTRQQEKALEELKADFERRVADKDEVMARTNQEVHSSESSAEAQWHAALEQWQIDKQALQQDKNRFEHELADLQARSENETHQIDETMTKLRMEITFKETEASHQRERMRQQMDKELAPLQDRVGELTVNQEQERVTWEARLRSKDDDLKMLKARLALRDKRLQDEIKRREKEVENLRKQLSQETDLVRTQYQSQKERLETVLAERQLTLAQLEKRQAAAEAGAQKDNALNRSLLDAQRQQLEENVKILTTQRDAIGHRYEALLGERTSEEHRLVEALGERERQLAEVRAHAQRTAEELRKRMEQLRHGAANSPANETSVNHAAWTSFEAGIQLYQTGVWADAIRAFEECLQKDPRWGAAHQYLSLAHHAAGHAAEAATAAARALQDDPQNPQLAAWVERLRAEIPLKKAS